MNIFTGSNSLTKVLKYKIIYFYDSLKYGKPKFFYINLGGRRDFKVGEVLRSGGNNGFKTISYGNAKIIGVYKETKIKKFIKKHPKLRSFLEGLGIKIRNYDYKCIAV